MKGKAELRISICVCIVLICFAVIFFGLSVSPQISGYKSWSSAINHDRFDESRLSDITLGIVVLILRTYKFASARRCGFPIAGNLHVCYCLRSACGKYDFFSFHCGGERRILGRKMV